MRAPGPQPAEARTAVGLDAVSCLLGGRTVLDGVTMSVEAGTIVGILGPNGAGKTTLLSLVIGLRKASAGTIAVLGESVPFRHGELRRRIGVILQETALYEELTAFENLRFAASLYRVPDAPRRIAEVLDLLGLSEWSGYVVGKLSGGLRRRLAIARALLHDPELLVIDEPTLGVDAETRHAIWSHLRLLRSRGTTLLVASNYLDEIQALCDTVAVLRAGRLVVHETPDNLVARAGRRVEVECAPDAVAVLRDALLSVDGVDRIDAIPGGVSILLAAGTAPDRVVQRVMAEMPISGIRIRAADLAEVFRALETVS